MPPIIHPSSPPRRDPIMEDPRFSEASRPRRLKEGDHPPHPEYHVVDGKPVLILGILRRGQRGFDPRVGPQFLIRFNDGTEGACRVSDVKIAGR